MREPEKNHNHPYLICHSSPRPHRIDLPRDLRGKSMEEVKSNCPAVNSITDRYFRGRNYQKQKKKSFNHQIVKAVEEDEEDTLP